jgi:carboxypeptidase Taq
MSDRFRQIFETLQTQVRETTLLQTAADCLEWDERTGMPEAAGEYRAEQISTLRGIVHQRRTAPEIGDYLQQLRQWDAASDVTSDIGATVYRMQQDFQRECKLPQDLVKALSRATVRGQQAWDRARKADDFSIFRPALQTVIELKRQQADCLVAEGQTRYDALLDEYEPGARAADLQVMFAALRDELVALINEIQAAPKQPNVEILRRQYPVSAQRTVSRHVAELIGFDFTRGRLDETSHPFCTNLGPHDCRILTRYESRWLPGGFFGTLHEAGHGLYDQGLRSEWYGLPPGNFISLGVHESQSRLWENLVGRSAPFWQFYFPHLKNHFPGPLEDVSVDQLHFALNSVQPSLIRVEADEATYNLHVAVRFELEQLLLSGDLQVDDLPDAWNQRYREVVGITPPSNADGVLQDVHWSAGLFGYFPTYSLGNIYAAQLFKAAENELGDFGVMFGRGEFRPLLQWLRDKIHRHGRNLDPRDLIQRATGAVPSSVPLVQSLRDRYTQLYGL